MTIVKPLMRANAKKVLTAFLIYNLMDHQKSALLERGVWSLTHITFCVLPLKPSCPDYLFRIEDLPTQSTTEVKNAILEVWHNEAMNTFLDTICEQQEGMTYLPNRQTIWNYMDSLEISYQDIRSCGNIPMPSFCIYTNRSMIKDSSTWTTIRKYLANREYKLKF